MDAKLARWAVLVFLDMPTIQTLHEKELRLARQKKTWETVLSFMLSTGLSGQFQLTPYWDPNPKFSEAEKEGRMAQFNAEIYPAWAKIWDYWKATWESPDCRPEIEVLHECDIAVFKSGFKPNRLWLGTIDAIREKSAKAKTYGRQFEEAMNA